MAASGGSMNSVLDVASPRSGLEIYIKKLKKSKLRGNLVYYCC